MFVFMYAGLTMMALFEGTLISSLLNLFSFSILIYGFVGSIVAGAAKIRYLVKGIEARNPKWLKAESLLYFAYMCLPAYYGNDIHEYEGLTINHVLILGGAAITTLNILRKHRVPAEKDGTGKNDV